MDESVEMPSVANWLFERLYDLIGRPYQSIIRLITGRGVARSHSSNDRLQAGFIRVNSSVN